ncbi:MAG: c-type cytochrome [Bryobacterales bacterium]|nr:c-type cytochrome [Bryobacterales bacterium]
MRLPLLVGFLTLSFVSAWAQSGDKIAYGKYLAHEVSKCLDCHTPKNEKGELDMTRAMKGKVMEYQPIDPIPGWHKTSPDITPSGRLWSRWGGEGALVKYLVTGLTPKGTQAGPPMPTYKMKQADAEAIVEYLKTLK